MADENSTDPNTTPPPVAPAPQPAATFTQADIDRAVSEASRKAHDAANAEARRRYESQKPPNPNAPAPQPAAPHAPQPTSQPDQQAFRAFDRVVRRFDLTDDALAIVEEDFARANPSDPAGWVASRATAYGWRTLGAAPNGTITTTPATTPAPAPPPMPGSTPPAKPVLTSDTPIMSLLHADPSQVARLSADIGAKKFVERLQAEWRATGLRVKR